jgi:hypothetical protein
MRMEYFGDSYDIVKKFLIHSLAPGAEWVVFPMFTHEVTNENAKAFESFIGARILTKTVFTSSTKHGDYLASSGNHQHIFLDPDTGIQINQTTKTNAHIYGLDLIELCQESKERLLLVYDQSFSRINDKQKLMENKMKYFQKHDVKCFYYDSHASFLILSASNSACKNAFKHLVASGLPQHRLKGMI